MGELKHQLTELCNEFSDIFSTELKPEPANIPPMEIKIIPEKWEKQNGTRLPARPQTPAKQEESEQQIRMMRELNVLQPAARRK